jgi:hypothetical protein
MEDLIIRINLFSDSMFAFLQKILLVNSFGNTDEVIKCLAVVPKFFLFLIVFLLKMHLFLEVF